jgi:excisionase family DNA binding protein
MVHSADDDDDEPKLRTIKAAMRVLGVGKTTIYELVNAGKLKKVKVGPRGSRITQDSLDEYLNSLC